MFCLFKEFLFVAASESVCAANAMRSMTQGGGAAKLLTACPKAPLAKRPHC